MRTLFKNETVLPEFHRKLSVQLFHSQGILFVECILLEVAYFSIIIKISEFKEK